MLMVIAVPTLTLTYLLSHDRDLDEVLAQARAQGVPTTWAEAGRKQSSPAALVDLRRLAALKGSFSWYQHHQSLKIGDSVPPALVAMHDRNPPALCEEVRAIIARFDGSPLIDDVDHPWASAELSATTMAECFARQDFLAAAPADVCARGVALLSATTAVDPIVWDNLGRWSRAVQLLTIRLDDLGANRAAIANLLRAIGEGIAGHYRRLQRSLFVHDLEICRDPWKGYRQLGRQLPSVIDNQFRLRVVTRLGRADVLRADLAWIDHVDALPDLVAVLREAKHHVTAAGMTCPCGHGATAPWSPGGLIRQSLGQPQGQYFLSRTALRVQMNCLLLAAVLDGAPWPDDPFAPPGTALRRIERDGTLVAGYSVGEDGIDGGGLRGDFVIPLYGTVDSKRPHTTALGR